MYIPDVVSLSRMILVGFLLQPCLNAWEVLICYLFDFDLFLIVCQVFNFSIFNSFFLLSSHIFIKLLSNQLFFKSWMIGKGTILLLHDHEVPNLNIYKTLFDDAHASNVLHTLPFSRLHPQPDEELTDDRLSTMHETRIDVARKRIARIRESRALLNAGEFDGFVAASKFHPTGLLDIVTPFLEGSRPVVVYHQYVEVSTCSFSLHKYL
jgi:hypothetical protein